MFFSYLCFVSLLWYQKENLQAILIVSMPLREMYSLSIVGMAFFYFLPILLGYITCRKIKESAPTILELLLRSLSLSLLFLTPILFIFLQDIKTDLYLFLAVGYLFLIVPILVLIGCLCNFIGNKWNFDVNKNYRSGKPDYLVFIVVTLVTLFIIALNLIPVLLCKYPVCADVYYHASLSNKIASGKSPFDSPIFYEGINYYPPLVHLIIAKLSLITHISVLDLWRVYPVVFSPIFILLLFYLSSYLTKDYKAGCLSIFFVSPWFTVLWMDPSPRIFSMCFLLLMLLFCVKGMSKKKYLFYAGITFIIIGLSHPGVTAIAIVILLVFTILTRYYNQIGKMFKFLKEKNGYYIIPSSKVLSKNTMVNSYDVERKFSTILLLYVCILSYFIVMGENYYGIRMMIFGEIALSLVPIRPIGAISFIVFLFSFPTLLIIIKNRSPENMMLISIVFLYTSVFFYLTKLWMFYHRYFAEVAYIGFAILAAVCITRISKNKIVKISIIASIMVLFFVPLPASMNLEAIYSQNTQLTIEKKIEILQDVKKLEGDVVILANPNDMINRYIPAITGKYIFSGRWQISKEQQWAVILGDFFTPSKKKDAQKRVELAKSFFENADTLNEILKNYTVTHILVTKTEYNTLALQNRDELHIISKNNGYILLKITKSPIH